MPLSKAVHMYAPKGAVNQTYGGFIVGPRGIDVNPADVEALTAAGWTQSPPKSGNTADLPLVDPDDFTEETK